VQELKRRLGSFTKKKSPTLVLGPARGGTSWFNPLGPAHFYLLTLSQPRRIAMILSVTSIPDSWYERTVGLATDQAAIEWTPSDESFLSRPFINGRLGDERFARDFRRIMELYENVSDRRELSCGLAKQQTILKYLLSNTPTLQQIPRTMHIAKKITDSGRQ
jgi:hypothetical protein